MRKFGHTAPVPAFTVAHSRSALVLAYSVRDSNGLTVDRFHTNSAAEHAARVLSNGACYAEPHRPLGARVMPARAA